MKSLLNKLGFYTKKQYLALKNESIAMRKEKDMKIAELGRYIKDVSAAYDEKLAKFPFQFDELILLWNDNQINGFFYKLVTHIRDHTSTRPLIQRWIDRLETAKKGIKLPN